ncbi:MAG: hypothetical protein PHC61_13460 [Chitinivibrionales bacterium]|nr:hypothetical protein [Chitinivibrionales bacterium]
MELFSKKDTSPLTLVEYLKLLPTNQIYDRFLKKIQRDRSIVSASRLFNLADRLSEKQNVIDRFTSLSAAAQKLCAAVYLSGDGGLMFEGKNAIRNELVDSLLVYPAQDESAKILLLRFSEFAPHLAGLLLKKMDDCAGVAVKSVASSSWPWRGVQDVVMLLLAASGGWLVQTKNGTLKKTAQQKLQRTMQCFENALFPGQHDKKSLQCLYTLLQFCKDQRLLISGNQALAVSAPAVRQWLAQPLHECYFDIVEYFQNSWPLWDLETIRSWTAALPKRGLALDDLFDDPVQWSDPFYLLVYLGFFSWHKSSGALVAVPSTQVSDLLDQHFSPAVSDKHIISGDFSAIFPQESSPGALYDFSKVGAIGSFDRVFHGKVSKESVTNSLVNGMEPKALLSLLDQFRAPHNVSETVKEWMRQFNRLAIGSGHFVLSSDELVSAQLASYTPLKNCIEPLNAHRIFLIKPGEEDHVRQIFSKLGFDWRMPTSALLPETSGAALESQVTEGETGGAADLFVTKKKLTPLIDGMPVNNGAVSEKTVEQKSGKYGGALKQLERGDLVHVLDYALIMGYTVALEYGGSLGIKAGTYSAVPVSLNKGPQACFEGRSENGNGLKKYLLEKILRIGVRGQ